MLGGVLTWVAILIGVLILRPEAVAELIVENEPAVIGGTVLVTIGALGGVWEGILIVTEDYTTNHSDESLTEVPWDE